MHLELVELFRCVQPHDDSVLVAAANRVESRYIIDGTLGCPVCGREYVIANGVANFRNSVSPNALNDQPTLRGGAEIALASTDQPATGNVVITALEPAEDVPIADAAMALAAQLGLRDGRATFALLGYNATTVQALRQIVAARIVVANAPDGEQTFALLQRSIALAPLAIIQCNTLPIAAGKLDGVALARDSGQVAASASNALRVRGRLVAPASTVLPAHSRELVRDANVWVAERQAIASLPVQLLRRDGAS